MNYQEFIVWASGSSNPLGWKQQKAGVDKHCPLTDQYVPGKKNERKSIQYDSLIKIE